MPDIDGSSSAPAGPSRSPSPSCPSRCGARWAWPTCSSASPTPSRTPPAGRGPTGSAALARLRSRSSEAPRCDEARAPRGRVGRRRAPAITTATSSSSPATPGVLGELDGFKPSRRAAIVRAHAAHLGGDGGLRRHAAPRTGASASPTLGDLQHYCYIVAGIVGELLTELFLDFTPALERVRQALLARAARFGEGLQLVNILKDADSDARHGRVYLPPGLDRAQILALARADLDAAAALRARPPGGGRPPRRRRLHRAPRPARARHARSRRALRPRQLDQPRRRGRALRPPPAAISTPARPRSWREGPPAPSSPAGSPAPLASPSLLLANRRAEPHAG